jgi:hypothetical protein
LCRRPSASIERTFLRLVKAKQYGELSPTRLTFAPAAIWWTTFALMRRIIAISHKKYKSFVSLSCSYVSISTRSYEHLLDPKTNDLGRNLRLQNVPKRTSRDNSTGSPSSAPSFRPHQGPASPVESGARVITGDIDLWLLIFPS